MENKSDIFQVVRRDGFTAYENQIDQFDINIKGNEGQSLLQEAIAYKQTEIALDLIERSIDVNIQDKKGQNALHILGFFPNTLLAQKIIESGGNLELKDMFGNTPLWYAVFNARGKYELVELFIEQHADPTSKNKAGRSPIDFARQIKNEKLIKILSQS